MFHVKPCPAQATDLGTGAVIVAPILRAVTLLSGEFSYVHWSKPDKHHTSGFIARYSAVLKIRVTRLNFFPKEPNNKCNKQEKHPEQIDARRRICPAKRYHG